MKILLGKIGQKIIFNRDSKECDRSNTNGNVGTYLLFKLLIENNPEHTFYIASDNDLKSFKDRPFDNVIDASRVSWELLESIGIDAMFILTGLTQFEKNNDFVNAINYLSAKYILLSDDPRCLDSVSNDYRFYRQPDMIVSQFTGKYSFKDKEHEVKYIPIERASCYRCKPFLYEKDKDMIIISNTSGKEYDRVKILSEIINGCSRLNIYGRLSEEERMLLGESNCKGELKYNEMQKVFRKAYSTFIVPIKKGWVTSKYVESLMNGVLPVFYKDYNTDLLEPENLIIVHNKEEFNNVLENVVCDKEKVKNLVEDWTKTIVIPYIDGTLLSNMLIDCLV